MKKKFYDDLKKDEWLKALEPLGTHADKPHLEIAPWLIIFFQKDIVNYQMDKKEKNTTFLRALGLQQVFL